MSRCSPRPENRTRCVLFPKQAGQPAPSPRNDAIHCGVLNVHAPPARRGGCARIQQKKPPLAGTPGAASALHAGCVYTRHRPGLGSMKNSAKGMATRPRGARRCGFRVCPCLNMVILPVVICRPLRYGRPPAEAMVYSVMARCRQVPHAPRAEHA